MQDQREERGSLLLSHRTWSLPAIAVMMEDAPLPAELMRDKTFRDALGEFTLKEQGRVETGDLIGVWIGIDGDRALFQPQELFVEKRYRQSQ